MIADREGGTGAAGRAAEDEGMGREMVRRAGVLKLGLMIMLGMAAQGGAAEAACRIAVLGDSLTSAFGLDLADGFPAQLQRRLEAAGHHCEVLDAGVSGDTSAGGRARLDWLLGDQPSHVIVELGGNDGLRGLPPEELERNLDAIITRLQAEHIKVLLAGMLAPPNLGEDYGRAFAAVFPRVAAKHGVPLYRFFLDGVAGHPELTQPDGIHPTAAGIALIARRILPTVEAWLDSG